MGIKHILLLPSIALVAALSSCGGETDIVQFDTDSVKYEKKTDSMDVSIYADFPKHGNPALCNSVAEFICEGLGADYEGPFMDGQAMLSHHGKQMYAKMAKYREGGEPSFAYDVNIRKVFENEAYVTYTFSTYLYWGGAHGEPNLCGATFRKSDGRHFFWDMLVKTDDDDFHYLMMEGVKDYFERHNGKRPTNEELQDLLIGVDNVYYIPRPNAAPFITKDGFTFVYQSYEIAPYAAGLIEFTIPFGKVAPFLTSTVKKMLAI